MSLDAIWYIISFSIPNALLTEYVFIKTVFALVKFKSTALNAYVH